MKRTNKINNDFVLNYMFGGKSEFVIENVNTKNRFLYQITKAQNDKDSFFIYSKKITTDTEEISKKNYSGYITHKYNKYNYRKGKNGRLTDKDKPIVALMYTIDKVQKHKLPECVVVKHTGRCALCGRRLTDDKSIERGFGNTCWKIMHEKIIYKKKG